MWVQNQPSLSVHFLSSGVPKIVALLCWIQKCYHICISLVGSSRKQLHCITYFYLVLEPFLSDLPYLPKETSLGRSHSFRHIQELESHFQTLESSVSSINLSISYPVKNFPPLQLAPDWGVETHSRQEEYNLPIDYTYWVPIFSSLSPRLFLILPGWAWGRGRRRNGTCESKPTKLVLLFLHGSYPNALPLTGHSGERKLHRRELSTCSSLMQVVFPADALVELAPCRQGSLPAIGRYVPPPTRGSLTLSQGQLIPGESCKPSSVSPSSRENHQAFLRFPFPIICCRPVWSPWSLLIWLMPSPIVLTLFHCQWKEGGTSVGDRWR